MRILIAGPSWVGDMCMAQVLFKILKHQYPEAIIDVLAPPWSQALLERMPEVNKIISLPFGHGDFQIIQRLAFGRSLRKENYDWSIVLPNSWKSAVIPMLAGIPKRTGWLGEARYGLLNDYQRLVKSEYPLMIQRFAALADFRAGCSEKSALPAPSLTFNEHNRRTLLEKLSLSTTLPLFIICPGAEFGITKIWPAEHVAEVANHYLAKGWQVWAIGSPNDREIANAIAGQIDLNKSNFHNLVGETKLADAVDLISLADLVLANDSGLMHIASALNRPTLAIYGSTSPEFTPPLGGDVRVLQIDDLYCRPCFRRQCKEEHLRCLRDIKPADVIQAASDQTIAALSTDPN